MILDGITEETTVGDLFKQLYEKARSVFMHVSESLTIFITSILESIDIDIDHLSLIQRFGLDNATLTLRFNCPAIHADG